jgi:hypothetical protein
MYSSETSGSLRNIRRYNPEDRNLYSHPHENLKSSVQFYLSYSYRHAFRKIWSRDRSVGTVTSYGPDGRSSIPRRGKRFFSSPQRPDRPTQPVSNEYRRHFSLWVKRPGRETDHLPPSSAKVKNSGATPPLPHSSS